MQKILSAMLCLIVLAPNTPSLFATPNSSATIAVANDATIPGRWSEARANEWYAHQSWLVGSNFIPSTAINQLEMWQETRSTPIRLIASLPGRNLWA